MRCNTKLVLAAFLLFAKPAKSLAQSPHPTKVSEFNIHSIRTIEERVFLLHSIQESDDFSYIYNETQDRFDIFVTNNYTCEDINLSSDFDLFLENCYNEWTAYSNRDKSERGSLFVRWRSQLEDNVFRAIYEDFYRQNFNRVDNTTCEGALPFCTDNGLYDFPANTGIGSLCGDDFYADCYDPYYCPDAPGQTYGCLFWAPNPVFYYMKISDPGDLNIYMYSANHSVDIDFDCWGPFDDITTACEQLSCSNIVDCSFQPSGDEHCHILDAQVGQYYVLLITNFGNAEGNILFENDSENGGATDCSILPPLVNNNGPYCVGDNIRLTASGKPGATYSWEGPDGFNSTQRNPIRRNCTMAMAGTYTCTIYYNGQTNTSSTEVVIYPKPIANFITDTVCIGNTTHFTSTSTTDPLGEAISYYQWDFGDGLTDMGESTSHTYARPGTYQVTLTIATEDDFCTDEITQTVIVNEGNTDTYFETICDDHYTWHGTTYEVTGTYIYEYLNEYGCPSVDTLNLTIIDLEVHIEVEPNDSICKGDTVTLHAIVDNDFVYVAVGDILCTDGSIVKPANWATIGKTAKGVVFYVDDTHSHGWAVNLTQSQPLQWSSENNLIGRDYDHWRDAIKDFNGDANTQRIKNQGTAATYPAAWDVSINDGWYLPSAGQLNLLFGELIAVNASMTIINNVTPNSATPFDIGSNYYVYWSSTEKNADEAMTIQILDGLVSGISKQSSDKYYVRAVIDF